MAIPFSQVRGEAIKLKVSPAINTQLLPGAGIRIDKPAPNKAQISVDFSNLERDDISSPEGLYVGTWDTNENIFKLVKADSLKGAKGDTGAQGLPGPSSLSDYATIAFASASTISAPQQYVRVAGYYAAGDGGGALYKKVSSIPAGCMGFTSADGAKWLFAEVDVNVLQCGAVGDAVADDTAAIQMAVDTSLLTGGECIIARRHFKISSAIIVKGATIRGTGRNAPTNIYPVGNTIAFNVNTIDQFVLKDFTIVYSPSQTGNCAIQVIPSGNTESSQWLIENLNITGSYVGINTDKTCLWRIRGCYFSNTVLDCINVRNSYEVDSGDSVITENVFAGTGRFAIHYLSSSGLRVINNKINGAQVGVYMEWDGVQSKDSSINRNGADLWVSNNSIEGISSASVLLTRSAASGGFGSVVISDNELTGPFGVYSPVSSNFLSNVCITGNTFIGDASASFFAAINYTTGFLISNNTIQSLNAGTRILGGGNNNGGVIGPNQAFGATTASSLTGTSITTINPT